VSANLSLAMRVAASRLLQVDAILADEQEEAVAVESESPAIVRER
jgi:hypothetical protein